MLRILVYAIWGMYRGMVERKSSEEWFVLLSIILLFAFTVDSAITKMLPAIFTILLILLWIAVRHARELREGDKDE